MKRKITAAIAILLILLLCLSGCNQLAEIDLKAPVTLEADGHVSAQTLQQIKEQNAVATFVGQSGKITYEWTLFGSDISEARDITLGLTLTEQSDQSITGSFASSEDFNIPLVLSIHLNRKWTADSALVLYDGTPRCSASVTGSENSILNFSVPQSTGTFVIKAEEKADAQADNTPKKESESTVEPSATEKNDDYLSPSAGSNGRVYSDGSATKQDRYKTDPVPAGKPMPVEPEDQTVNQGKKLTCTFSIECTTIFNNLNQLEKDKLEVLPKDGIILKKQSVVFYEGESVYDVLRRICKEKNIHLEASFTPMYNSAYVEGIHNLYEFDCGELSGWMYQVNGWYPNYGCSRYQLAQGDDVQWRYTCDLGKDVGCTWMANS